MMGVLFTENSVQFVLQFDKQNKVVFFGYYDPSMRESSGFGKG